MKICMDPYGMIMLLFSLPMEAMQYIFVVCCNLAFIKTRSSHISFQIFQIFFPIFEGWTLPSNTLVEHYGLDHGWGYAQHYFKAHQSCAQITIRINELW